MLLLLTVVGLVACIGSEEGELGEGGDPFALSVGSSFEIVAEDGVWTTVADPTRSSEVARECRIPPGAYATIVDTADDELIRMSLEMCGTAVGGTFCADGALVEVTRFSLSSSFRLTLPVSSDITVGDVLEVRSAENIATGDSECITAESGSIRIVRVRPQCNEAYVMYNLSQAPGSDEAECPDETLGVIGLDSLETWLY